MLGYLFAVISRFHCDRKVKEKTFYLPLSSTCLNVVYTTHNRILHSISTSMTAKYGDMARGASHESSCEIPLELFVAPLKQSIDLRLLCRLLLPSSKFVSSRGFGSKRRRDSLVPKYVTENPTWNLINVIHSFFRRKVQQVSSLNSNFQIFQQKLSHYEFFYCSLPATQSFSPFLRICLQTPKAFSEAKQG